MDELDRTQLKSEIATLRLRLEVNEAAALEQAARADRAMAKLRESAAAREVQARQLREVTEASIDAVFVLDASWKVQYVNTLGAAMLPPTPSHTCDIAGCEGYGAKHHILNSNLFDLFPGLDSSPFGRNFHCVMSERKAMCFLDHFAPLGRWYEVSASPVGDGIAIFLRDVTEARQQEDALRRTEKLAAVGRLASSISHEINNPLESVVNLLYLIEHSDSAGDEMRTYAKLATSELARVSHIVTQTLKFHRQSLRAQQTRMADILESVVSLFQGRLNTLHIRLHRRFDRHDTICCLAGDIRQVFANLIGNALDAMQGDGDLWLRTRRSHNWKTGAAGLRITVADNGCGMSSKTLRNLFEAFYTTKPTTGTGLGLWVSQGIVESHGGVIRVRSSQVGGRSGTVFSLFFPLVHEMADEEGG